MKATIPTTAERFRRYQRDLQAYRRRHLWRRSHKRFHRDLAITPNLFLAPGSVRAADLARSREAIVEALRGKAIWTLDTAARLACGIGFLAAKDLTCYLHPDDFEQAVSELLITPIQPPSISVTPVWPRNSIVIAHLVEEPPSFLVLESGDRVVPWKSMIADIKGTIGWRPDILTRLESAYLDVESRTGMGR